LYSRRHNERREIETRLCHLDLVPVRVADPEAVVDTILEGLAEASRPFEHGTMEERKRVVRAFVESLTIDGLRQSGETRIKRLPVPEPRSTGSSFDMVAGVRYEAQQRNRVREPDVVPLSFTTRGTALVPAGAMPAGDGAPLGMNAASCA
jgi:hypothetical protein